MTTPNIYDYIKLGLILAPVVIPTAYWVVWAEMPGLAPGVKVHNKRELEKVVQKEAEKLGLDTKKINVELSDHFMVAGDWAKIYEDGSAEIYLNGPTTRTGVIKHELYHIKRMSDKNNYKKYTKNHTKRFGILRYLFNEEPRAVLYQMFGLDF